MELYGLDDQFRVVTVAIPYTNLQWKRKYYEAGQFSMQIPLEHYDGNWKYIWSKERPEMAMIEKVRISGASNSMVQLSGFFAEKMLDRKTCYPRYTGDVAKTETAVRNIFEKYKDDLPIKLAPANSPLLGDRTQSDFSDDQMATKLFKMLQTRELSYRVTYDYASNQLLFGVWKGKDRTQSQNVIPYKVFSEGFGNIADLDVNIDESAYKNYAIIPCNADEDGTAQQTFYIDLTDGKESPREIVLNMRSEKQEDEESLADYRARILEAGLEKMEKYKRVNDIDVDQVSDEGYMTDYDLGDVCDVLIESLGLKMEVRIVEVSEVFKKDGHKITLGFGTKRLTSLERVALQNE